MLNLKAWIAISAAILACSLPQGSARAADPDLRATAKKGKELETVLQTLLRRAKHPNYPGTTPGAPSADDLARLERDFKTWQAEVETGLRATTVSPPPSVTFNPMDPGASLVLPDASTEPCPQANLSEVKICAINIYMNELMFLVSLRIAMNLPHTGAWLDDYGIKVSKDMMSKFPGLGSIAHNRLGDAFSSLVIDRGADGHADPIVLKMSTSLVQGLELGRLADQPNDQTFFTMVQYLATRQLLQNLVELRYLKRSHEVQIPAIPAPLNAKLESFGLQDAVIEEQRRALAEPGARAALTARFEEIVDRFPPLADAAFSARVNALLGSEAFVSFLTGAERESAIREQRAALTEGFGKSEREQTKPMVATEIRLTSLPLAGLAKMEGGERIATLARLVASAKTKIVLAKVNQLYKTGAISLTQGQRSAFVDFLDARRDEYALALPAPLLQGWFDAAKAASENELFTQQREEFVSNLITRSASVAEKTQAAIAGERAVPALLTRAFAPEIAKLAPRASVHEWLYEVGARADYAEARDTYAKVMARATDESVVVGGIVDPARVERYLETHDFRPEAKLSEKVTPALATKMLDQVVAGRKADIRAWLAIGDLLSFTKVYPVTTPSVRELLPDTDRAKRYFKALDDSILTMNPILGAQVEAQTGSTRLCDALAALNVRVIRSPEGTARAEGLIDQAIGQAEAQAKRNLVTVAQAKSLAEIEKVVTSSMMLSLVMKGFPEFHVAQEAFLNELLSTSLTTQIMHRYGGNYLTYGFSAMMLLHGATWVARRFEMRVLGPLELIEVGTRPLVAGYMRAAMLVIAADTIFQAHELHVQRQKDKQVDDFFRSGVSVSFFEHGEAQRNHGAYEFAKWMFVGRVAMDTLFMWLPMARGAVGKRGAELAFKEFMGDVEAFNRIGVEPGNWKAVPGAREAHARWIEETLKKGAPVGTGGFDVQAHARLMAKIAAKNTWSLPTAREILAREEAFRMLGIKNGAWDKIDDALAKKLTSHALSREEKETIERCARYLKIAMEVDPEIVSRDLPELEPADRRLIKALHNFDFRKVIGSTDRVTFEVPGVTSGVTR